MPHRLKALVRFLFSHNSTFSIWPIPGQVSFSSKFLCSAAGEAWRSEGSADVLEPGEAWEDPKLSDSGITQFCFFRTHSQLDRSGSARRNAWHWGGPGIVRSPGKEAKRANVVMENGRIRRYSGPNQEGS